MSERSERGPSGPAARTLQVLGLAVVLLAFLALAGPTLDVGTDLADPAGARPLAQTGTGTTEVPPDPVVTPTTTAPGPPPPAGTAGGRRPVARGGIALVDQTDWLVEGEPFDLWIALGDGVDADGAIVIDLHAPVTSRSQFTATLAGELLGARRTEYVVPIDELPAGPDGSRRLRLTPEPTEAPGERALRSLPRPGVYPLRVGLRPAGPGDPPPPFTTYLVRTPTDGTTPLLVALVQPVRDEVALQPDGAVALSSAALDRLEGVAEVLAASAGTPMTLTPRPETLEALRLLAETDADARSDQAASVLDALAEAAVGRQVVSGPFVDLDLDALEAAGLGDEVAAQRRRGDDAVEEAVGVGTDVRTWVEDDGASPRALRRLAGLGVDHLVLPDGDLSPVDLRLSLSRPFAITSGGEGFGLEATSPEPALSARYADEDPILGAQHLLADLAVLHGDEPGPLRPRGIVVAPPAGTPVDPVLLDAVLDGLADSPVLDPVTLDGYFAGVEPEGGEEDPLVRDLTPSGGRLGITADDVDDARSRVLGFESVVGDGDAPRELEDLILLAQADQLGPAERRSYLAAVAEHVGARLGSIRVVDSNSFRLPDSEGTIPLTIARDGGELLSVQVVLESDRLEFDDAPSAAAGRVAYQVELAAENTPLVVPVRVRSPGTFPLLVSITSPDGRLELARTQVTVRSTAFSGVGVALSAGAGLFLLLWWARHWRTVRRARRLVPVG